MQRIQRYCRTFWIVASLLIAGGQLVHASSDFLKTTCQSMHSDDDHSHTDAGENPSTEPQHCCHEHSPANSVVAHSAHLVGPNLVCVTLTVTNDCIPEPPVREIDYPPQLA